MAHCREDIEKSSTDSIGSDRVNSLLCVPCYLDNETKPAHGYCIDCKEHLCDECYRVHKKPAPLRHHRLQDKVSMPTIQQLTDPAPTTVADPPTTTVADGPDDRLTTLCTQHNTKILDQYCKDHNLVLCSICVVLSHKNCPVKRVADISQEILDCPSLHDTVENMDKLKKKCGSMRAQLLQDTQLSTESLEQALLDLKIYRQDINKRIDELEQELEDKIRALKQQNIDLEKTHQAIYENIHEHSRMLKDNIKHKGSLQLASTLFVEIKQAQKQLLEYEDSIRNIMSQVSSLDRYKFEPGSEIYNALYTDNTLGDIKRAYQVTSKPTSQESISVDASGEQYNCYISGMTVISPDKLVVLDFSNQSIKLINKKKVVSKLSFDNIEKDSSAITTISNELIAVAVPREKCIQLISVSDKLSKEYEIKTNGAGKALGYHQNKLIVIYNKPSKLEILDMKGYVIRTIATDETGDDIFNKPRHVQASQSYIYVSDSGTNEIIMLNWDGDILTRYKDFSEPRGLALIDDDCLLVCDHQTKVVYKVSRDCQYKQILLEAKKCPESVCVDKIHNRLYMKINSYQLQVYNI